MSDIPQILKPNESQKCYFVDIPVFFNLYAEFYGNNVTEVR
jgi:hypothetical protein